MSTPSNVGRVENGRVRVITAALLALAIVVVALVSPTPALAAEAFSSLNNIPVNQM